MATVPTSSAGAHIVPVATRAEIEGGWAEIERQERGRRTLAAEFRAVGLDMPTPAIALPQYVRLARVICNG